MNELIVFFLLDLYLLLKWEDDTCFLSSLSGFLKALFQYVSKSFMEQKEVLADNLLDLSNSVLEECFILDNFFWFQVIEETYFLEYLSLLIGALFLTKKIFNLCIPIE